MRELPDKWRLAATAAACSAMVTIAGIIALMGSSTGVIIASVLLTAAFVEALVGSAYAANQRLGVGILALIAAGFPLFLGLYMIGQNILRRMGAGVAGGLLIGLGVGLALAAVSLFWWGERSRRLRRAGTK
jgi:hypothetical protein